MSNYKLIQLGYATYGEGETIEAARTAAREWLDSANDADDAKYCATFGEASACLHGSLIIVDDEVAIELGDY